MNGYQIVATALIVGLVGPLLWLGVGVLENRLRRLLSKQIAQRKARRAAADLGSSARIGQ